MTKEEAIEAIKMAQAQVEWDYPMDYAAAFDMAIEALKQPEIVRCKDCKHKVITGRTPFMLFVCNHDKGLGDGIKDSDFCSYGERKDGEI